MSAEAIATVDRARALIAQVQEAQVRSLYKWQPIQEGSAVSSSCGNCPPKRGRLLFNRNPHPGFGYVSLIRNGVTVGEIYDERGATRHLQTWAVQADADPDATWWIQIESPMSGVRYERKSLYVWLAVARNIGFA